jgi:hypothetical protein
MAKRFAATEIWDEDWFLEMPNEYKLFWFYMLSTCDHAGLFRVNVRSFSGLLGVKVTPSEALKMFNVDKQRVRVISDTLWFIEDFFVFQYGTTFNPNNKMHDSVEKLLLRQNIPMTSVRGLRDLKDRVKDKVKDKDKIHNGAKIEKSEKAVEIDEKNLLAVFADGSYQPLGQVQQMELKRGALFPKIIEKGIIQ